MLFKSLKLIGIALLTLLAVMSEGRTESQDCGLKSETSPVRTYPSEVKPEIRWGENTPDFVRLVSNLQTNAPRLLSDLVRFLEWHCEGNPRSTTHKAACEFLPMHREYQATQSKLKTLVAAGTFETTGDATETVFRSLNWTISPFAESATSDDPHGEAVTTMIGWMFQRRMLRNKLSEVEAEMKKIASRGATFNQTILPALKAHFSSPLLVGQISEFLRAQNCGSNPVCREANRQLKVWLVEQMQPYRKSLNQLKCIFETSKLELPSSEVERMRELYREDTNSKSTKEEVVSAYVRYLTTNSLSKLTTDASSLAKARLGTVIVSEVLHVFERTIAHQEPLASDVIHPEIAKLENRIQIEIEEPIFDLQEFLFTNEEGLR